MKRKPLVIVVFALILVVAMAASAIAASTYTKQVTANYGVTVMVDGSQVNYKYDNGTVAQAFIVDGVTYLPVRAVAQAVGKHVTWDSVNKIVYLGRIPDNVVIPTPPAQVTVGMKNALQSAKDYLALMAFSKSGLVKQLEFEGYTNAEATYAVDNCGADWYAQAAKSAGEYLSLMPFSRSGLIKQLEFEGFTHDQAVYGATASGL